MKVLIVDDEAPARNRLRQLLGDAGDYTIVGEAGNGQEALDIAGQHQLDIVLLDIRMPGMDGIETAHHLNKFETPPAVVFTTAYDECAIDAFEANAIGYVLKPIRRERLAQALQQAARLNSDVLRDLSDKAGVVEPRKNVCARVHGELKLIPINSVGYFIADQKYVSVVHSSGSDLIDDPLKALEEEFERQFVRIHRGALVALSAIESLKKTEDGRTQVMLRNITTDGELIVSRRHITNVKRRLKKG
ncbi:MAG: LytTR family DNA-binding domain-containing protein [Woeseiaceae bacterium]|nr:LytTR family DNA-binding domain-containing protein [Woeseiaceae bacterium]